MGYTTYFEGYIDIEPPLNADELSFLKEFTETRRMNRSKGPLFVDSSGNYGQNQLPDIVDYNNPHPDQPGLWCKWTSEHGHTIMWNEAEKFYDAAEWMDYIVNKLFGPAARSYVTAHLNEDARLKSFTFDHVFNGEIFADGEDSNDRWKIVVKNNQVKTLVGVVVYEDDDEPDEPTEEEVAEVVASIAKAERAS